MYIFCVSALLCVLNYGIYKQKNIKKDLVTWHKNFQYRKWIYNIWIYKGHIHADKFLHIGNRIFGIQVNIHLIQNS